MSGSERLKPELSGIEAGRTLFLESEQVNFVGDKKAGLDHYNGMIEISILEVSEE